MKNLRLFLLFIVLGFTHAQAAHVVFDGSYQNGWSGPGTVSFDGYVCIDASGDAWSWHDISNSSGVDLTVLGYFEYEIYFDSAGGGNRVEWHVIAPDGGEWNGTYQFMNPLQIDGAPSSYPHEMTTDAWHTVRLDCSAQSWWLTDGGSIRYIKWQWPQSCTVYIRAVRFVQAGNVAPSVEAGENQTITSPVCEIALNGSVIDDGLPDPPAAVTSTWSMVSGPAAVAFGDVSSPITTATFSAVGTYQLRLTADDSELNASDTVMVTLEDFSADLNDDGEVDLWDLAFVAEQWLQAGGTPSADIHPAPTADGIVNLPDYSKMANHWSQGGPDEQYLDGWRMAGANPQRTSWVPEEVRGRLYPQWYRPMEPFINMKTQIIAVDGLLYISTARGLYALDAVNGDVEWVYPTEIPLGNAPTVVNNVAYVGGYDRTIHAINATTGEDMPGWTAYEAGAGFETNPLVIGGKVYAGNRDGYFYAFDATTGALQWRYQTDGPILFSAAYNNGVIYFASNDAHAYALNTSGGLVWKSAKLPGSGFHSWWPVIYGDKVVFAGGHNYSYDQELKLPNHLHWTGQELYDVYQSNGVPLNGQLVGPRGTEPGDWVTGTPTCDMSLVTEYFESKPWRRTYFVLDAATGAEFTFDSDNDSHPEYAPFLWTGDHSGTSYPGIIGSDGVLYNQVNCVSDEWIARCIIAGWKRGTEFISLAQSDLTATDEIIAYSAGGNVIYWKQHWDLEAGSFDITMPNTTFPEYGWSREWKHVDYNLSSLCPGYNVKYPSGGTFYATDGVYRRNGNQCPLIPYNGRVYYQGSNCIIAFGTAQVTPIQLPMAQTTAVQDSPTPFSTDELKAKLATEVQKMVDAGHLRPGWHGSGLHDGTTGTYMTHYFYCPSETLYTLVRALPYLPEELRQQTRTYLQQEFTNYPPYNIAHMGWRTGAAREAFDTVPEIQAQMDNFGPRTSVWAEYPGTGCYWTFPQFAFYGMWKYAQEFGGASTIFNNIRSKLQAPPSDTFLSDYPHILNAFIAGYIGYLELQQMAEGSKDPAKQAELNRLMSLRVSSFSKDSPFHSHEDVQVLNVARNFIYLVPELADYLHDHILTAVQGAVDEYNDMAAGWFVSKYDVSFLEGCLQELYDYPSIFQAKAMILKEPREELSKYLDVAGFARGDLFYIQNLICAIEASEQE